MSIYFCGNKHILHHMLWFLSIEDILHLACTASYIRTECQLFVGYSSYKKFKTVFTHYSMPQLTCSYQMYELAMAHTNTTIKNIFHAIYLASICKRKLITAMKLSKIYENRSKYISGFSHSNSMWKQFYSAENIQTRFENYNKQISYPQLLLLRECNTKSSILQIQAALDNLYSIYLHKSEQLFAANTQLSLFVCNNFKNLLDVVGSSHSHTQHQWNKLYVHRCGLDAVVIDLNHFNQAT